MTPHEGEIVEGAQVLEGASRVGHDVSNLVEVPVELPRVSVVIPAFNHAESLGRLLNALRHSQVPAGGMEVIVVDDGSSDHTADVALHAGVHHIWQKNAGTAAARDRGWRAARGDVIVFFDDDVLPDPDAVALLSAALEHADGAGARFVAGSDESAVAQYTHLDGLIDHRVVGHEVRWLITGAAAFRRSALETVNGFDLGFIAAGEDVDLSLRLVAAGCTLTTEPKAVVRHFHRARFKQLLETCYRYGTFSRSLASRHGAYRGERVAMALRRINPIDMYRLYRQFRQEANRRRSLLFLLLHQLVVFPYALGLIRSKVKAAPLAAPSWRKTPATRPATVELQGRPQEVEVPGFRTPPREPAREPKASAV